MPPCNPQSKAKADGYISLSAKAGKLLFGEDKIVKAAQAGGVKLLLLDEGAGRNTKDRMQRLAAHHELPLIYVEDLGEKAGRASRMAAALIDKGLSSALLKALETNETE